MGGGGRDTTLNLGSLAEASLGVEDGQQRSVAAAPVTSHICPRPPGAFNSSCDTPPPLVNNNSPVCTIFVGFLPPHDILQAILKQVIVVNIKERNIFKKVHIFFLPLTARP